jgi:hypothetical protein
MGYNNKRKLSELPAYYKLLCKPAGMAEIVEISKLERNMIDY